MQKMCSWIFDYILESGVLQGSGLRVFYSVPTYMDICFQPAGYLVLIYPGP